MASISSRTASDGCGAPGGGILFTSSTPTTRFQVWRFRTSGRAFTSVARLIPADCVCGPWQR